MGACEHPGCAVEEESVYELGAQGQRVDVGEPHFGRFGGLPKME